MYVLTKEEGGRHTPFYNGYRPQFYLRTTDVTGAIGLPDGAEMVMPGDNVEMTVELITPIALEVGQRFAIREGGRTVGAGAITRSSSSDDGQESKRVRSSSSPAPSARSGPTPPEEQEERSQPDRAAKYCPRDRRHTLHREAKYGATA